MILLPPTRPLTDSKIIARLPEQNVGALVRHTDDPDDAETVAGT